MRVLILFCVLLVSALGVSAQEVGSYDKSRYDSGAVYAPEPFILGKSKLGGPDVLTKEPPKKAKKIRKKSS